MTRASTIRGKQRFATGGVLLALALAATAHAAWTFTLKTASRDTVEVRVVGDKALLCVEFSCSELTQQESFEVGSVLLNFGWNKSLKP